MAGGGVLYPLALQTRAVQWRCVLSGRVTADSIDVAICRAAQRVYGASAAHLLAMCRSLRHLRPDLGTVQRRQDGRPTTETAMGRPPPTPIPPDCGLADSRDIHDVPLKQLANR